MAKKSTSKRKGFKILFALIVILGLLGGYVLFIPNTGTFSQGEYFYIPTSANYESVAEGLHKGGFVRDLNSFKFLAKKVDYPNKVKPGRYLIKKGMSNFSIVRLLRSGKQASVKLVITKLRTKQDFIKLVVTHLEADSATLAFILQDNVFLAQYGLDSNTAMCAIMPNTYEFFWNSSAEKVFKKIAKEYVVYWNNDRKQMASKLGITPQEVISLASIVEEETNKNDEKPLIASVYLNRKRIGMRLQADPTARFAYGDFMIKRITGIHTSVESPYNTYKVEGLPPGPICTPSVKTIDAVLHSPKNDLLYFCAKEDFSGYHNFASNLKDHNLNAQKYHRALNARGIK
jgi:UPF0755 protein